MITETQQSVRLMIPDLSFKSRRNSGKYSELSPLCGIQQTTAIFRYDYGKHCRMDEHLITQSIVAL